jgi:hypothetical protein
VSQQNKPPANRGGNPNWVKGGPSPNPGGRPKGFGARIRELTQDGEELITIALKVARGEYSVLTPCGGEGHVLPVLPTAKEVMDAVKWLASYGIGAPPKQEEANPFESMTDEELVAAAREELEREGNAPSTGRVQ